MLDAATDGPWRHEVHGTDEVAADGCLVADCGTIGRSGADADAIAFMRATYAEALAVASASVEWIHPGRDLWWCRICHGDDLLGHHARCPVLALDAAIARSLDGAE